MKINELQHYPRFVFNCSDGRCYSTADLDGLMYIKRENLDAPVDAFNTGETVSIVWDTEPNPIKYVIKKIDIRDIRYDTNENLYGIYEDDCTGVYGKEKFHLLSIFIFLEAI
ncbi:hypothetical protein ACR79T_01625 [Sphingobacterium spiritivorum]|uniref:hypothetical protein n=1 Tax=Sphingobacterium spiritivorum TaxID=258 RepID=UPI003DA2F0B9